VHHSVGDVLNWVNFVITNLGINGKIFKGPKPEIAAQMRKMLTVAERDNSNAFEVYIPNFYFYISFIKII
jgi:hypothetical protein